MDASWIISKIVLEMSFVYNLGGLEGIWKGCPHVGHNENGFVSGISQPQKGQVMEHPQVPHG